MRNAQSNSTERSLSELQQLKMSSVYTCSQDAAIYKPSDAEVANLDLFCNGQKYILRLQVSMNHTVSV